MTKSYGVGIYCAACHAEPFPDPGSGYRETFDLLCIDGEWLCEQHRKPLKQQPRKAQGEPKSVESSS